MPQQSCRQHRSEQLHQPFRDRDWLPHHGQPCPVIAVSHNLGRDQVRERGTPIATISNGLFPAACGSKNLVVSSS